MSACVLCGEQVHGRWDVHLECDQIEEWLGLAPPTIGRDCFPAFAGGRACFVLDRLPLWPSVAVRRNRSGGGRKLTWIGQRMIT